MPLTLTAAAPSAADAFVLDGLQLLFQVAGQDSGGIVSVDALSTGAGRFKLASLAMDMQDGTR